MSLMTPSPEEFVGEDHPYRSYLNLVDFEKLVSPVEREFSKLGRGGYPISSGFKCLVLQFLHDLSDRETEEHIRDSLAARYFCGFTLEEATPDHTYFCRLRDRIGTKRLAKLFNHLGRGLKSEGHIREIFTFVDASKLTSRIDNWKARDQAIADEKNEEKNDDGKPTMNNKNVGKYSSDPNARFGAKSKNDIWLGYKRHAAVDMRHGLISKTAVTPANVSDAQGLKHVCPSQGAVVADKAYCVKAARLEIARRGCHPQAILKNNMKGKDRDKDRFLTRLRMPYEGVFSKLRKTARFRTTRKVQFQAFMEAIVFNIKRLVRIGADPIPLTG